MKKIMLFIICMLLLCTCFPALCFAEGVETAVVKALEVPVCVGYAYNCNELSIISEFSEGDQYITVRTPDGAEGLADERWLSILRLSKVAIVRNERVEVFSELLRQGDEVEVISRGPAVTKVMVNGVEGEIESRFLRFEGEEEFVPEIRYTASGTELSNNPWLRDPKGKIVTGIYGNVYSIPNAVSVLKNKEVTVLEPLGECCLVEIDGEVGYIASKFALEAPTN